MRRYWIDPTCLTGDLVLIKGDVHHHIFDVCRQQVGSKFEVLTGDGKARLIEVTQVGKKEATGRVIEDRPLPTLGQPRIHLALCLPRLPVFEAVVEKSVEMGVASIQPLFSDFSFFRDPSSLSTTKLERWQKIVRSAMQQSGRAEWLDLRPARRLEEFFLEMNRKAGHRCLIAYEGDAPRSVRNQLSSWKPSPPSDVVIFVGGEGGFSLKEIGMFTQHGQAAVTLGPQVLRVETACMALVSVLKYEFDLMC